MITSGAVSFFIFTDFFVVASFATLPGVLLLLQLAVSSVMDNSNIVAGLKDIGYVLAF